MALLLRAHKHVFHPNYHMVMKTSWRMNLAFIPAGVRPNENPGTGRQSKGWAGADGRGKIIRTEVSYDRITPASENIYHFELSRVVRPEEIEPP